MKYLREFSVLACLTTVSLNAIGADVCDLSLFSEAELNEPYKGTQKILKRYSRKDAEQLSKEIITYSKVGLKDEWFYKTQEIRDGFGNLLRFNGSKSWNSSKTWQYHANDKATTLGYFCSWGGPGGLESQCLKTCSLQDVTIHPGD